MAVNTVQQLINRRKAIEKELRDKQKRLEELQKEHYRFWSTFRTQCSEAFHDQVPEQVECRRERSVFLQERQRLPLQQRLAYSPPFTMDDLKMMKGYSCPYCRGRVGGYPSDHDRRFDIDSRSDFASWLVQDISNWPQDRVSTYEKAKKEVVEYFAQVEPMEQCIYGLIQERQDIDKQLDAIWNMCDKVLGKSREYKGTIAKLNRELTPYDRDAYYND